MTHGVVVSPGERMLSPPARAVTSKYGVPSASLPVAFWTVTVEGDRLAISR
jgi:hypothetical protein